MCINCQYLECYYPGDLCDPEEEDSYLSPEEADLVVNPPAFESEYSMSTKVEVAVAADDNGIITKQSEVFVWNDTVFASYKGALAASKKSVIIEKLCRHYYRASAVSETQMKTYIKQWTANPQGYAVYTNTVIDVVTELLAE